MKATAGSSPTTASSVERRSHSSELPIRRHRRAWARGASDSGRSTDFNIRLSRLTAGRRGAMQGTGSPGAWADGAAFASTMTTFSATTAVAWFPGQNTFYVTSDAGHRWYSAWPDGAIVAVTSPNDGATLVMRLGPSSMTPTEVVCSTDPPTVVASGSVLLSRLIGGGAGERSPVQ